MEASSVQKEHHNIAPGMAKAKSISVKEVDTIIVFTILIASYGHSARADIATVGVAAISLYKW